MNVFTITLKLEKKIGGPSTIYLKLIKERRASFNRAAVQRCINMTVGRSIYRPHPALSPARCCYSGCKENIISIKPAHEMDLSSTSSNDINNNLIVSLAQKKNWLR